MFAMGSLPEMLEGVDEMKWDQEFYGGIHQYSVYKALCKHSKQEFNHECKLNGKFCGFLQISLLVVWLETRADKPVGDLIRSWMEKITVSTPQEQLEMVNKSLGLEDTSAIAEYYQPALFPDGQPLGDSRAKAILTKQQFGTYCVDATRISSGSIVRSSAVVIVFLISWLM